MNNGDGRAIRSKNLLHQHKTIFGPFFNKYTSPCPPLKSQLTDATRNQISDAWKGSGRDHSNAWRGYHRYYSSCHGSVSPKSKNGQGKMRLWPEHEYRSCSNAFSPVIQWFSAHATIGVLWCEPYSWNQLWHNFVFRLVGVLRFLWMVLPLSGPSFRHHVGIPQGSSRVLQPVTICRNCRRVCRHVHAVFADAVYSSFGTNEYGSTLRDLCCVLLRLRYIHSLGLWISVFGRSQSCNQYAVPSLLSPRRVISEDNILHWILL